MCQGETGFRPAIVTTFLMHRRISPRFRNHFLMLSRVLKPQLDCAIRLLLPTSDSTAIALVQAHCSPPSDIRLRSNTGEPSSRYRCESYASVSASRCI